MRCEVREALSEPFEANVVVSSTTELDLDSVLGREAGLHVTPETDTPASAWTFEGICALAEHMGVADDGASLYALRIVPPLWQLTRRENHRVFSKMSIPEIAAVLLAEWNIEARWTVDRAAHLPLACRLQYGETDLDFLHRLLDEAGIAYSFEPEGSTSDPGVSAEHRGRRLPALHFTDAAHVAEPRHSAPLPLRLRAELSRGELHVTDVVLRRAPPPPRVTLRGFDFRRPEHGLTATVSAAAGTPDVDERYRFETGAFWVDGDAASVGGRALDRQGKQAVDRTFAALASDTKTATLRTNALDLSPGAIFSIDGHPCTDLAPDRRLFVLERTIEGGATTPWHVTARAAVSPPHGFRPHAHKKPRLLGVQSAIVVGPPGEEIHTDEHGRVRIRFPWQREDPGKEPPLWVRVNQGWAGVGFGMLALPRVGQEVLVEFFDGDPDHPVIIGRVYNATHPVPHALPEGRSKSTWRSATTPGSEGHNELTFDDARGRELVHLRAERDRDTLVRRDSVETVGNDRTRRVGVNESIAIGTAQSIAVGASRTATIGALDTADVGLRHTVTMAPVKERPEGAGPTQLDMIDRKITLTTGEATLTLEGPNITLEAAASILLKAVADITIAGHANIRITGSAHVRVESEGADVVIQGAPYVRINPEPRGTDEAGLPPVEVPPGVDLDENVAEAESDAWYEADKPEGFADRARKGGAWHPLRWGETFADFGYFQLGLMGRAIGLPVPILMRQAGKLHQSEHGPSEERGDPGNGLWGGRAPYGNDPRRAELIQKGAVFYDKSYR